MNTYIKIMLAVLLTLASVALSAFMLIQGYSVYVTLSMMGVL